MLAGAQVGGCAWNAREVSLYLRTKNFVAQPLDASHYTVRHHRLHCYLRRRAWRGRDRACIGDANKRIAPQRFRRSAFVMLDRARRWIGRITATAGVLCVGCPQQPACVDGVAPRWFHRSRKSGCGEIRTCARRTRSWNVDIEYRGNRTRLSRTYAGQTSFDSAATPRSSPDPFAECIRADSARHRRAVLDDRDGVFVQRESICERGAPAGERSCRCRHRRRCRQLVRQRVVRIQRARTRIA
jgi:hypothetical protein